MTLIRSSDRASAVAEPTEPLVSIVTPTFPGREKVLLERCMPSVCDQNWLGPVEHVIVSDENPKLRETMRLLQLGRDDLRPIRFVEINSTWKRPNQGLIANGAVPWMLGSRLALGEFLSFLGDDDELLSHHVSTHVRAMQTAEATWSISKVEFRARGQFHSIVGDESYMEGHLDATGIMCWKGALRLATWDPDAATAAVDWKLVDDWRRHGLFGVFVDSITGIHHDGWVAGMTGKPYDAAHGYE